MEEKPPLPNLPAPTAPPKPARPAKPRPKSRISRYRSSSSQRARRQRQALAQQAAAAAAAAAMAATPSSADQGAALDEEGSQGPYGAEHGHGESGLGSHLLEGDGHSINCINRGNLRYPKTKKVSGHRVWGNHHDAVLVVFYVHVWVFLCFFSLLSVPSDRVVE